MISLLPVHADDARLARLLQLYIHEWSGLMAIPIGADGLYVYDELALYRDTQTRGACLFIDTEATTPIGFALVMRDSTNCWHVEEFFVIAGARRRGIGRLTAEVLFATQPGRWSLTVRSENPRALDFWRSVCPPAEERVEVGADGVTRTRLSFEV